MIYDPTPRIVKILDAISQLLNVLLSWDHKATTSNESVSGKAHRLGLPHKKVINTLFFWEDDHCRLAYEKDVLRAKQVVENDQKNV